MTDCQLWELLNDYRSNLRFSINTCFIVSSSSAPSVKHVHLTGQLAAAWGGYHWTPGSHRPSPLVSLRCWAKLCRAHVFFFSNNDLKTINEPETRNLLEQQRHTIQRQKAATSKQSFAAGGEVARPACTAWSQIQLIHPPGHQSAPTLPSWVTGYLSLCYNNFWLPC